MNLFKKLGLYLKSFRMMVVTTEKEKATFTDLSPEETENLFKASQDQYTWLDVRTTMEFEQGHIPGAKHIPVDQLEDRIQEVGDKNKSYVVYCQAGGRSAAACQILHEKGFQHLWNAPGMGAWNGPTQSGQR